MKKLFIHSQASGVDVIKTFCPSQGCTEGCDHGLQEVGVAFLCLFEQIKSNP